MRLGTLLFILLIILVLAVRDHEQPDRDFAFARQRWRRQCVAELAAQREGISVLAGLPDPPQGSYRARSNGARPFSLPGEPFRGSVY